MKKVLLFTFLSLGVLALNAQTITVNTGASYADDVFYSFENGTVKTVDRSNWDIAFSTNRYSVSIISNYAAGTEVYTYGAGDTAAWATLDTTGMTWNTLYNSTQSWEGGAFTMNATGHPDYGWGIYNMGNHHIVGDSLYVIKTVGGNYKKLWIEEKDAVNSKWYFKYADLDGANMQSVTIDAAQYVLKNFVYYSFDNNSIEDREPNSADWDLLFTKYFDYSIPYHVTGVLSNEAHVTLEEVKRSGLDQASFNTYTEANFSPMISTVGSDWKSFNMGTFSYDLSDTTVFFAKTYNSNGDSLYYKFYFTAFGGSATGAYTFEQSLLLHSSISQASAPLAHNTYPNPAQDIVNIELAEAFDGMVQLFDLQGKIVLEQTISKSNGQVLSLNISSLQSGSYVLKISDASTSETKKLIKL